MTLERWREQDVISQEQYVLLSGLARREPFSIFLELNLLLYVGVIAFAGGLAWTVTTYSERLGDVLIIAVLTAMLGACLWYSFRKALPWTPALSVPPNLLFDYVLYLGALTWSVELAYIESRFRLLQQQWDVYVLATALFYFALAYRFDNRFVLSMALSALAAWFGIRISHWPGSEVASYRNLAIAYSFLVAGGGTLLERSGIKPHFHPVYLHLAANVLLAALITGTFEQHTFGSWLILLTGACAASVWFGASRRSFAFVGYGAVYGYIGVSSVLVRYIDDGLALAMYFTTTAGGMLVLLGYLASEFRGDE
jgi:hypothetical protein